MCLIKFLCLPVRFNVRIIIVIYIYIYIYVPYTVLPLRLLPLDCRHCTHTEITETDIIFRRLRYNAGTGADRLLTTADWLCCRNQPRTTLVWILFRSDDDHDVKGRHAREKKILERKKPKNNNNNKTITWLEAKKERNNKWSLPSTDHSCPCSHRETVFYSGTRRDRFTPMVELICDVCVCVCLCALLYCRFINKTYSAPRSSALSTPPSPTCLPKQYCCRSSRRRIRYDDTYRCLYADNVIAY